MVHFVVKVSLFVYGTPRKRQETYPRGFVGKKGPKNTLRSDQT